MTAIVYGIRNCDSVKKAKAWLDNNQHSYQFHDFRIDGLSAEILRKWIAQSSIESVINKRSTTWKQLDQIQREAIIEGRGESIILENTTVIKRPVLEKGMHIIHGFKPQDYLAIFQ